MTDATALPSRDRHLPAGLAAGPAETRPAPLPESAPGTPWWKAAGSRAAFPALAALVLALAVTGPAGAAPPETDAPELIPLEVLLGNPTKSQARISPDGTRLSYLAPSEKGVLNVWVRTLGAEDDAMLTQDEDRGIRIHFWAEDGKHLLYLQDIGGDENWHVYSVHLESKQVRDLTPFFGVRAENIVTDRRSPNQILVGLNLRDRRLFDMHRIDLTTGAVVPDTENPGDVVGWLTDPEFRIRAALASHPQDGSTILRVRDSVEAPWRDLVTWPWDENGTAHDFSAGGGSLYVESSLDSDTTRLLEVDAATGEILRVLAHHEQSDVGSVLIHPETRVVQAVSFEYEMPEWRVLDPSIAADVEALESPGHGVWTPVARDRADRRWILHYDSDTRPGRYYAYDRESRELEFLFTTRPALERYALAPRKPVVITARDGLELVSYLTTPLGVEPKKLPMVLYVHGGPWGRDQWGYDPIAQWLANRGYAVLQVNFRASTGFGKKFMNAGNREWGVGSMQHDLTDAVQWAVDQGIADPAKVAIMGGSYGGYATLAGLTFTPQLYACGVDIVGMSNMRTVFGSIPPYWQTFKKQMLLRVGDVEQDEEYNRQISPLFHADKIRVPLLIGQGANDPRVNVNESNQMVEAMRGRGLPVTYVVYPDEGHGFAKPANRLDFNGRADRFLADCLGGRAEAAAPIDGSSAVLR